MLQELLDSSFICDRYKVWTSHRFPVTITEGVGDEYIVGSIDSTIRIKVAPVKVTKVISKEVANGNDMLGFSIYATEYTPITEIDIELLNGSLWTAILTITEYEKKKDKVKIPLKIEVREHYILNF